VRAAVEREKAAVAARAAAARSSILPGQQHERLARAQSAAPDDAAKAARAAEKEANLALLHEQTLARDAAKAAHRTNIRARKKAVDTGFRISSGLADSDEQTKLSKADRRWRALDRLAAVAEEGVGDDDGDDDGDDACSTAASAAMSVAPSLTSVATAALARRLEVRPHARVRAVQRGVAMEDPAFLRDLKHGHRRRTHDRSGEPSTEVTGAHYVIWLDQDGVTVKSVARRW
jgi:hypothetical protein